MLPANILEAQPKPLRGWIELAGSALTSVRSLWRTVSFLSPLGERVNRRPFSWRPLNFLHFNKMHWALGTRSALAARPADTAPSCPGLTPQVPSKGTLAPPGHRAAWCGTEHAVAARLAASVKAPTCPI